MSALVAVALVATVAVLVSATTPAHANISGAVPANGFGEPTYDFTTEDALFAYVVSDIKGGRVCVVAADDEYDSGDCDAPAFGEANRVVGIGTIYTLLEGPPLAPGPFMLRWEKQDPFTDEWVFGGTGEVFTVGPCLEDCTVGVGAEQARQFKDASRGIRTFNDTVCALGGGGGSRGVPQGSLPSGVSMGNPMWSANAGVSVFDILPTTATADIALSILTDLSCAVGEMYQNIADDPPDPNYDEIAVADPIPVSALRNDAETALATAMARNHAFGDAALHSFERYQGAELAGDTAAQRVQAGATAENVRGVVAELRATVAALRTWDDVAAADPDLAGPVFATTTARNQLAALYQRVVTDGFTAEETADLVGMGYSPVEIEQVRTHFGVDLSTVPVGADVATIARSVADGLEAQIPAIEQFARHMASIAATSLADPVASFSFQQVGAPNQFTFTSTSTSPDGDPLQLRWSFGDGTTGTGASITHAFPAAGPYDVTLTADDGFATDTDTQQVWSGHADVPPNAVDDLLAVQIGATGTINVLANDTDAEGDELTVTGWTPAGGGTLDCEPDGTCTYEAGPDPGRDRLLYTVTDGTTSVQGVLRVDISQDGSPVVGDLVLSLPKNGGIAVDIPIGDPDTPTAQLQVEIVDAPAHGTVTLSGHRMTYVAELDHVGTDQLTYRAFDGTSWSPPGTADITVVATNSPPVAVDDSVTAESGVPIDIPLVGTDSDGNTLSWYLDAVPAHGSLNIDGATARYRATSGYVGPDSFRVRATDGSAPSEPATITIDVVAPSGTPIVDLGPDRITDEGLFSPDVSGVFDPDGSIVSWEITWGDGDTDSGSYATTHHYDDGVYTLTIAVTDDDGLTASDSMQLTVRNVAPAAPVVGASFTHHVGTAVGFSASTSDPGGDELTYEWVLDDGVTSTELSPQHTYMTPGTRLIQVTVTDDDGFSAIGYLELSVEPLLADLGPDLEVPEGSAVVVEPTASPPHAGAITWTWDLGDGATVTGVDRIEHRYSDDSPRTITLEVANAGASASDAVDVTFSNLPPVVAPAVPVALDPGAPGTFLAGAIDPGADAFTVEWDFGDGTTASGPHVQHAYAADGDYVVTVTVTDDEGAVTEATAGVVEVAAQPERLFTNRGRSFSIAFNENVEQTPTTLSLLISGEQDTTGYVAVPGLGFRREFAIEAGRVVTVVIPTAAMRGDGIGDDAVLVRARREVSVHGLNREQFTTDAFMAIPDDVAGVRYRGMAYQTSAQLAVVATEPDTQVTVGEEPPFVLQPGEVWRTSSTARPVEVTGWLVTSDKPVQVYSGNWCVSVLAPFCDHLAEAIPATETWGERFLTVPLATRLNGDTFRILADQDGTVVSIDGVEVATLDAGQHHEQLIDGPAEITSTAPILVAQFSNGSDFDGVPGDPFMALVPPFEQWLTTYATAAVSGIDANHLNLVVRDDGADGVTVDGTSVTDWVAIGDSGYLAAQVPVGPGEHRVESGRPVSVMAYGFGSYDSYGYPGGMAIAAVASADALTASPDAGTAPVGEETCVTAHVSREDGSPVGGIRVDVERAGANPGFGSVFTNADGDAQHCYVGTAIGEDTIQLSTVTLSAAAARTWEAPPATEPSVSAGPDRSVVEGSDVVLDATVVDLDAASLTVSWSPTTGLDDPSSIDPTFTAVDDGERTFTLLGCDGDACASDTVVVTTTNAPPVLTLDAPLSDVTAGGTVSLAASFSDAGTADTHTATIDWGDGDGAQATAATGGALAGEHTYDAAGLYGVTACVRDDDAGIGCVSDTVAVAAIGDGGGGGGAGGDGGAAGTPPTGGPGQVEPPDDEPIATMPRLAGPDRDATSVAISRDLFPERATADVVVLATADTFVDALAGTPLAVALNGPLLLTPTDELDPRVADEIRRVLTSDGEVILLGGTAALDASVEEAVRALGVSVRRVAGATRFSTAVAIAGELPGAERVLLVDGWQFPDALVAGAAASQLDGIVLLTDGDAPAEETSALLAGGRHTDAVAVGGPAARAHPDATAVAGRDRYDTAVLVATELLGAHPGLGFASGAVFADALPGGAHAGARGWPLVLLPPTGPLPESVSSHLVEVGDVASEVVVYGGTAAVDDGVLAAVLTALAR